MKRKHETILLLAIMVTWYDIALADGIVIDRVYHPYVQALEQEVEVRAVVQDKQPGTADNTWRYQLAYGHALGDHWFAEIYLVGKNSDDQNFDIQAYEVEAKRQLTEQGEFWADWGLLFELEKNAHFDAWEFSTAVLAEKEWGQWSGTANFHILGEWGTGIKDELETKLALQARYRYSRGFEPALEFYSGQGTIALGPVFLGQIKLGSGNRLRWEAGFIFGLDNKSPNQTIRLLAEFEF